MTTEEIDDTIRQYKREKQVKYEKILDALHEMEEAFVELQESDAVIEALLRQEIDDLRRKVHIVKRNE